MAGDRPAAADGRRAGGIAHQRAVLRGRAAAPQRRRRQRPQRDALQKLLAALESLDREASTAGTPADQARFTARRAELLEQIAAAAKTADERGVWLRQLADMLSASASRAPFPTASSGSKALLEKLESRNADKNLIAYIKFRQLTTSYVLSMQAAKADTAKIQAIQSQVARKRWKTSRPIIPAHRLGRGHAATGHQPGVQRAGGRGEAVVRADRRRVPRCARRPGKRPATRRGSTASAGSSTVQGQTSTGRQIDISQYRGKIVLVQYWTTTSPAAKADMATLKEMWNKYGRSLAIVGVSLDNDVKDLNAYLGDNPLPWPQIFEEGGLDSRPANALGILTIPTMILADQEGKVVNRNVSTTELESEIKKLLR